MGKFINKCCVCGTITSVVTDTSFDGEKISHGYCSDACAGRRDLQFMVWSEGLGIFTLDVGHECNGRYFFQGKEINVYIILEGKRVLGVNASNGQYNEEVIVYGDDVRHAVRVAKEEARKYGNNLPIIFE